MPYAKTDNCSSDLLFGVHVQIVPLAQTRWRRWRGDGAPDRHPSLYNVQGVQQKCTRCDIALHTHNEDNWNSLVSFPPSQPVRLTGLKTTNNYILIIFVCSRRKKKKQLFIILYCLKSCDRNTVSVGFSAGGFVVLSK